MNKLLIAGSLAATTALAQLTGDHMMGKAGMMGGTYGGTAFSGILMTLFWVGLVLLVWLWVIKMWKEVRRMK